VAGEMSRGRIEVLNSEDNRPDTVAPALQVTVDDTGTGPCPPTENPSPSRR
jgi:hypothetical protein